MNKFFTLAVMAISFLTASSQTISHNAKTNTTTFTTKRFYAEDYKKIQKVDSLTTYEYEVKSGEVYQVFKGRSGAFYIWRVSKKSGKPYRMYLPREVQKAMGREYKD